MECSVVTEFTDHICVTMDAELIMFLHDLVSAYLKEKEKGIQIRVFIQIANQLTFSTTDILFKQYFRMIIFVLKYGFLCVPL